MSIWEFIGALTILFLGIIVLMPGVLSAFPHRVWHPRTEGLSPSTPRSARPCFLLFPGCWMVIKAHKTHAVQAALNLHSAQLCTWMEGLTNADKLFVSPPVKGWILVTGNGLPDPTRDPDACFRFLLDLSRKLGNVQLFSANRFSQHYAWVRLEAGRVLRAYAWAGQTLWLQGEPTAAERELNLTCLDYGEPLPKVQSALLEANLEKVPLLAARWGLDPTRIRKHLLLEERGVVGKPAHYY